MENMTWQEWGKELNKLIYVASTNNIPRHYIARILQEHATELYTVQIDCLWRWYQEHCVDELEEDNKQEI